MKRTEKQQVAWERNSGKWRLKGVKGLLENMEWNLSLCYGERLRINKIHEQLEELLKQWDLNNKDFFGLGKRKESRNG
jgi:hypothetical protein